MSTELSGNSKKLYELLFTKDFRGDALVAHLKTGAFSKEDVNLAALRYVDDCPSRMSYHDYEGYRFGEEIPWLESSHLLEAIHILLDYGLDPNTIIDGYENIQSIDDVLMWYTGRESNPQRPKARCLRPVCILRCAKRCGLELSEYACQRCPGYEPRAIPPDAFYTLCDKLDAARTAGTSAAVPAVLDALRETVISLGRDR